MGIYRDYRGLRCFGGLSSCYRVYHGDILGIKMT